MAGIDVLNSPWPLKGMGDYEEACGDAEVKARIASSAGLRLLVGSLEYDKRKQGNAGRCLTRGLATLGLLKGDRLEPSPEQPNVAAVDNRTDFPFVLTFWRTSAESQCRHRNPLFSRRSYITPEIICIDELHTLHLGVFGDYSGTVVWQCLDAGVWGAREGRSEDAYTAKAVLRLKSDLMAWYKRHKRTNPGIPLYELADLQVSMIGSREAPTVKTKAGESGTFLRFAVSLVHMYKSKLRGGNALAEAGDALLNYLDVTRSSPLRMAPADRQRLADAVLRFVSLREAAGVAFKPKAHLFVHVLHDAVRFGNPYRTGTWLDEGLNSKLAAVCASAHACVWSQRVLATFQHELGPTARASRVAKKARLRT